MKHEIVSGNRDEALSIAEVKIKQAIKNWKGYSAKASEMQYIILMHIKEETLSHRLEPRFNSETSEQQLH